MEDPLSSNKHAIFEEPPIFDEPSIFEEPFIFEEYLFYFRRTSIFDFRSRRSKNSYFRSSKPNNEEPFIFNLRSSAPTMEEFPHIFDLRPRRTSPRSDGRGEWWCDFFEDWRFFEDGGFFDLSASKNEGLSIFEEGPEEQRTLPSSTFSTGRANNFSFSSSSGPHSTNRRHVL